PDGCLGGFLFLADLFGGLGLGDQGVLELAGADLNVLDPHLVLDGGADVADLKILRPRFALLGARIEEADWRFDGLVAELETIDAVVEDGDMLAADDLFSQFRLKFHARLVADLVLLDGRENEGIDLLFGLVLLLRGNGIGPRRADLER